MHWFWRALIAFACGFVPVWVFFVLAFLPSTGQDLRSFGMWMIITGFIAAVCGAPMLAVYDRLTYRYWRAQDRETRCRKCDYILRGITEPRCPECGERI